MHIAKVMQESLQDGKGCNLVVVCQGCSIHCPGCHNQELWPSDGGYNIKPEDVLSYLTPVTTGLTVSGGEPTDQPIELRALLHLAKAIGIKTTLYTGHEFDELRAVPLIADILDGTDYIKCGPFVEELRDTTSGLYGSTNQKLYEVHKLTNGYHCIEEVKS